MAIYLGTVLVLGTELCKCAGTDRVIATWQLDNESKPWQIKLTCKVCGIQVIIPRSAINLSLYVNGNEEIKRVEIADKLDRLGSIKD
jgi:hypothetical protein